MRLADSRVLLVGVLAVGASATALAEAPATSALVPMTALAEAPATLEPVHTTAAAEAPATSALVPTTAPVAEASAAALAPTSGRPPAPRSARLLTEGAVGVGLGLAAPLALYAGFTALQSFVGFFAGFLSATVVGAVLAPIGVIVAGRLLGAEGGVGRGVVGALLGLLAGLLVGLPLATVPGAGYLVGLALLWALPAAGTLIGFEWGRAPVADSGVVVLRF